jgi:hypothetical protein
VKKHTFLLDGEALSLLHRVLRSSIASLDKLQLDIVCTGETSMVGVENVRKEKGKLVQLQRVVDQVYYAQYSDEQVNKTGWRLHPVEDTDE